MNETLRAGTAVVPAGTFTASVLLDVLALVADGPADVRAYRQRAADFLKVGLGAAAASLGLDFLDALQLPGHTPAGKAATRKLALGGAIFTLYLLELAAREAQLGAARPTTGSEAAPLGFSLVALVLLGLAGRSR